jgi:chromosome partition protein MukB
MRANLDACRRTRAEVAESRVLERDISDVHEAGVAMFRARTTALHASVVGLRAAEKTARAAATEAVRDLATLGGELEASEASQREVTSRLAAVQAAHAAHATLRARAANAHSIAERLAFVVADLERTSALTADAAEQRRAARTLRDAAAAEREGAREAYERAARGLGDLDAGLDELRRRAHAQRLARTQLQEARRLLRDPDLAAETALASRERARDALAALDARLARAARDEALAAVRQDDRERAFDALAVIAAGASPNAVGEDLHGAARRELARLAALEHVAARRGALEASLAEARVRAARAGEVRVRAAAAGLPVDGDVATAIGRAFAEADAELRRAEEIVRDGLAEAASLARAATSAEAEALAREVTIPAWLALEPSRVRLSARAGEAVTSSDDVLRVRSALTADRARAREEADACGREQADSLREAEQLAQMGGLSPELLAVRDALSAELLASRLESTAEEEAAWLEAALGELSRALVVSDPAAAAEALAQHPEAPETVWLVAEDDVHRLLDHARSHVGSAETVDVVVKEAFGTRVTRRPLRPLLGREARTRKASELRALADRAGARMASALEAGRAHDVLLRDADRLLVDAVVLAGGDPAHAIATARARAAAARALEVDARARAHVAGQRVVLARERLLAVQALLADAHWLAPPDPGARVLELASEVEAATHAAAELSRTAASRSVLETRVDALRVDPDAADGAPGTSRAELEAERDRLFAATEALADVLANKDALAWDDLDGAASREGAVRASLEEQHAAARARSAAGEETHRAAESRWEQTNLEWQTLEARRGAEEASRARLALELEAAGGASLTAVVIAEVDAAMTALACEEAELAVRDRTLATEAAIARERRARAEVRVREMGEALAAAEAVLAPAEAAWRRFTELASAAGVVLDVAPGQAAGAPADHLAEARGRRALLVARLAQVRGGAEGRALVEAAFERASQPDAEAAYLEAWLAARAWAMRRLPAQLGDAADPAEAIARLRADLGALASRVEGQEADLKGASADVARGIDVQLRKTAGRVRRLNRDLENVAFGSVGAVRIHVKRVERMDLVLRGLRGGDVQELLFQSDMPLEEALAEIFRRYGGGSRAGAAKILDYREYVELVVEIQRRGKAEWEVASPTRLSTGEAIGVGAALMMVVLTEWERDANLLRSDRATGTLRFLFLDEANRLSPDNLGVLFDLCRVLDLQLLVAAPEVARAQGNTTYRLVRHVDAAGREEVLVSGRRAAPPLAPS